MLATADFEYIIAESRHPHALHQNALYMALIRGNLDIADAVLSTIIARLNDFRSLQPHRTSVCFSVSFVHTYIFAFAFIVCFQLEFPTVARLHPRCAVRYSWWLPCLDDRVTAGYSLVHAGLSKENGTGNQY